jgi:hypothetical protein
MKRVSRRSHLLQRVP